MGLRRLMDWFTKRPDRQVDAQEHDPGPLFYEVQERQNQLERMLEERKRRRDAVQAQLRGLRGH